MVGALSNDEEVKELENVVKMFFIEERVMDLTSSIEKKKVNGKTYAESLKNISCGINNKFLQFLTVRGLN